MIPSVKEIGKVYKQWEKYSISTKTFELRPFEKPDMSPYLIHMTNEEYLLKILESKKLSAITPSQSMSEWYDEKIVCFTESPTFAIDFFRYKSYKRWCDDLRFGLGFSKLKLAKKGVRPALYVEKTELIKSIAEIKKLIEDESENVENNDSLIKLKLIYKQIAPYMTPLDFNHDNQGFLWEREWRFANSDFNFEVEDIEIICCPNNEKEKFRDVLGNAGNHIKYIETWGEYDEISKYLTDFQENKIIQEKIEQLMITDVYSYGERISQELSKLKLYEGQLQNMLKKIEIVKATIKTLEARQIEIDERIEAEKEKLCVYCGYDFHDVGGIAIRDWNEDGHFCNNCYVEMKSRRDAEE